VKSGSFFTYTAFSPENEAKVRASLQAKIDRLRKDGVTKEEVRRRSRIPSAFTISLQTRLGQVLGMPRDLFRDRWTA
jgi:predicted Zn-dependent peptidase